MKLLRNACTVVWLGLLLSCVLLTVVPLAALFGVMCLAAVTLGVAALPFVVVAYALREAVGDSNAASRSGSR